MNWIVTTIGLGYVYSAKTLKIAYKYVKQLKRLGYKRIFIFRKEKLLK